MRLVFLLVLVFSLPASAISVASLSKKIKFTRGVYKAQKGSDQDCISGKFEIVVGEGKALHMTADERVFASNIHRRGLRTTEGSCKLEYATKIIKNGFVSSELIECAKPATFYKRVLRMQRKSSKTLEYTSVTQNSKNSKKKNLRCRLKLVSS